MKFTRRNIQRINRNGEANNFSYSTSTSKAVGGSSTLKGNYLPAIYNGDGSYVVDVTKVLFKGNITAEGEMTAHKQGTDGEISGGQIVVYDGLDSTDSTIALSANQGRILKGLIDNKADGGGGTINPDALKDYAKKDGSNVSGTWGNLSIGGNAATADILKAYKHNEYNDMLLISGTRSDGSHSRKLIDDGFDFVFEGKRPKYLIDNEKVNLATIKDNVASATRLKHAYSNSNYAFISASRTDSTQYAELRYNGSEFEFYKQSGAVLAPYAANTSNLGTPNRWWRNVYTQWLVGGTDQSLVLGANNGEAIWIHTNQKVGIGTSSPSQKLEVNGNIVATGEITAYATNAKTLEETPATMALADEEPRVYDGLDSTEPLVSLSANQGRVLLSMIEDLKGQVKYLQEQINDFKNGTSR